MGKIIAIILLLLNIINILMVDNIIVLKIIVTIFILGFFSIIIYLPK